MGLGGKWNGCPVQRGAGDPTSEQERDSGKFATPRDSNDCAVRGGGGCCQIENTMRRRLTSALVNSREARALLYFLVPMNKKLQARKRTKKKDAGAQIAAHAEVPPLYASFTIYGFKVRRPQQQPAPLVRCHRQPQ